MMGKDQSMPKKAKELTAMEVGRLKEPGLYPVGNPPGLYLQVVPSGARTWIYRAMMAGKRRDMGLGGFPGVTLAMAREAAREARQAISGGVDPIEARKAAKREAVEAVASRVTFQWCAEQYLAAHRAGWKNAKHADQWANTLKDYAYPVLGDMLVSDVTREHVVRVLNPIWTTKNETASRLRGRVEKVLDWAKVAGYRAGDNPAAWKGNLSASLPKPSKVQAATKEHQPAVQVAQVGAFVRDLRAAHGAAARALEFALLTAARSGEVLGMVWGEVDMTARVWTVPASRMKAGKEHRVPLSEQALQVLEGMGPRDAGAYVFKGRPRKGNTNTKLSNMAMNMIMRRMAYTDTEGRVCVPHGLRSTFRDWAGDCTAYPRDVVEAALAHAVGDETERAYRRGDALERRRALMQEWAQWCDKAGSAGAGVVVPLRAA
jgi:integrase